MILVFVLLQAIQLPVPQPMSQPRKLPPERLAVLEQSLSAIVLATLPQPLYRGESHWGETKRVPNGILWTGKGLVRKPEWQYSEKNHGTWSRYLVTLDQPVSDHLTIHLHGGEYAGNNTLQFVLRIEADVHFDVTQQRWQSGIKLFDGSLRGKVRVALDLKCESKLVIEPNTALVPVVKYRLRVLGAEASYSGLKIQHLAGVGGAAAELLGKWWQEALHQVKPSVERNLIAKFTQKIVKAADTREIQLSLAGIERQKRK